MIDVVTNLLGQVVEVRELGAVWSCTHLRETSVQCRGVVRAVYLTDQGLTILVESHSWFSYGEKKGGGLVAYSLDRHHVRPVQQCVRCKDWDQGEFLTTQDLADAWEHKVGEGCRQVKIFINKRECWMNTRTASYKSIVGLALMQGQPSVTYRRYEEEKERLNPGDADVYLVDEMIFDVVQEGE